MEKFLTYSGQILTGVQVNNPDEIVDIDNYRYYHRVVNINKVFSRSLAMNKGKIQDSFNNIVGGGKIVIYKVPKNNKKIKKIL